MVATAPTTGPAAAAAPPAARRRDGFLDLVRAVATVRVVAWHAYGAPVITWVVAAVPTMFFVTGDLLAASAGRRPATAVVRDRLRRIGPPLWVLAAVAWGGTALAGAADGPGAAPAPLRALAWLVPVVDPPATAWEGGWLSSPLWYLRVLLWLLLLAPALLRAAARRPGAAVGAGVAGVVVADHLVRSAAWTPAGLPDLWWYVADAFLYGTFLLAGAAHRLGTLRCGSPRARLAVAGAAAAAAVAWSAAVDVPSAVVNDSHVLHLLVGAAWLAVILAAEAPLRRLAAHPRVAPAVGVLGRRALTLYLWHTAAIVVALAAARRLPGTVVPEVAFPLLVAVAAAALLVAAGWVEDLAARRPPVAWPGRLTRPRRAGAGLAAATAAVVALAAAGPGAGGEVVHQPPVPSQRPPTPRALAIEAGLLAAAGDGDLDERLGRLVRTWAEREGVAGVLVGVRGPDGRMWRGGVGAWPDTGAEARVEDRFDGQSVMKLFTGAAVLRAADAGLLDLDAPVPDAAGLADLGTRLAATPRRLLEHRSGLVDFRSSETYVEAVEAGVVLSPAEALAAGLQHATKPKALPEPAYASTNFLALGLLLEAVHDRPFAEIVGSEVFEPLGLARTEALPPGPGTPNGGAAGIATTVEDLLVAAQGLFGDAALGPRVAAQLASPDPATGYGPGSIGFCPCSEDPDEPRFALVGHMGGGTIVAWAPGQEVAVALHVTDTLWVGDRIERATAMLALVAEVAAATWSAD